MAEESGLARSGRDFGNSLLLWRTAYPPYRPQTHSDLTEERRTDADIPKPALTTNKPRRITNLKRGLIRGSVVDRDASIPQAFRLA
jgi:hypothetical protein